MMIMESGSDDALIIAYIIYINLINQCSFPTVTVVVIVVILIVVVAVVLMDNIFESRMIQRWVIRINCQIGHFSCKPNR